ncbi:MAG: fatty acid cis/trans isomerase [Sulfurimonas sp.]|nr:fatty acid cis/trans isomerase [Sulfurimonas sp.]
MVNFNIKRLGLIVTFVILLFTTGCSTSPPLAVKVEPTDKKIDYLLDVKPIFDKRCVTCHSCYNSPCQAKLSSFEGVDRGASKELVYNGTRLSSSEHTRLFIDAQNTLEWRDKDFYSITKNSENNSSFNNSIMIYMLHDKAEHPDIVGDYEPESDKLICPRNTEEMGDYLSEKKNHGMPYGFPALKKNEYNTLAQWLQQGAKGPSQKQQDKITKPSHKASIEIDKWQLFLNKTDAKHIMTARYLYEHLFLAHINFKSAPKEFYELVRSKTPAPQEIDIIASIRPFDDPNTDKFYYRFRKIHSTITHKTHMVMKFDDTVLDRFKELFIQEKWSEEPHVMSYETKLSTNPFLLFAQIPVKTRYQFLLDNSNYVIMTFIRGPVCRGQIALNVINDHFWVLFKDPKYDIMVQEPSFLLKQAKNLAIPIESIDMKVYSAFNDDYRDRYSVYWNAKQKLLDENYPDGHGLEAIWKGNKADDTPLLTIYRHFNSASVHKGALGNLPKTMWVIDYAQLERIYYTLVAGYDVYGNIAHQTNIRRYMDFLRMEGELNFLSFMPKNSRQKMFNYWYSGDKDILNSSYFNPNGKDDDNYYHPKRETKVIYKTDNYKREFIEQVVKKHLLKSIDSSFDKINYDTYNEKAPTMPERFDSVEDMIAGARSLTAPGTGFLKNIVDGGVNVIYVRVEMLDGTYKTYTLIANRWHSNVNSLFSEDSRLDSSKDTLDIIPGLVGSYPNGFMYVHYKDLPEFFDVLKNFKKNKVYKEKILKYFILRSDKNFWEAFDWFLDYFNRYDPINAGLFDLNRYYKSAD